MGIYLQMSQQRGDSRAPSAAQSYVHRLAKKWAILAFDGAFSHSCIVAWNVDTYAYSFIRANCKGLNILCLICFHSLRLVSHAFVAQFGSSFLTSFSHKENDERGIPSLNRISKLNQVEICV